MGSQRKIDQIPFKKVLGNSQLTQNELYTLLVRIEACLNSRPLTPLTSDPNDLEVLTPFHFLIGETHTTFPEQDWSEAPTNRLSRWQLIEKIRAHFWKRWNREYLPHFSTESSKIVQGSTHSSRLRGCDGNPR
jgi:hypothetical protein